MAEPYRFTKDNQHRPQSQSQNIKQESTQKDAKADNDSSSWNVVVTKRQHVSHSSKPTNGWGNKSKQQNQKPGAVNAQSNQKRYPKQQNPQQQHRRTNNYVKNGPNNNNSRKPQQGMASNENAKKKAKPKPKGMTVGDLLPLTNKKKFNKDSTKKVSQQQQQPPKKKQQRQQHNYPVLHTESVQDFPALGAGSFPALPQPSVPVVSKKGWGNVPPPAPSSTTVYSNKNNGVQDNTAALFPEPSLSQSRASTLPRTTQQQPTRVLKKGEVLRGQGVASTTSNKKRKEKPKPTSSDVPSTAASFFQPRPRDPPSGSQLLVGNRELQGEEHELLRLVQERNVYQKKGRQRVAPRKKKFTALKKKVLQERLDQWRALHPEEVPDNDGNKSNENNALGNSTAQGGSHGPLNTRSVCLYNYAEPDELEDDDEYVEILENLTSMAEKIGPIEEVFLPRSTVEDKGSNTADDSDYSYRHPVFVLFQKESDASAALACWSDWLIGGNKLEVVGLEVKDESIESPLPWSKRALEAESYRRNQPGKNAVLNESKSMDILLQKVLTEDDYEDEDCMSESLADLKEIALRFGTVENIQAAGKNGDVIVTYDSSNLEQARGIAQELCRVVVGGQPLYASVCEKPIDGPANSSTATSATLLLENVLTEDDLQDSDCLQESLNDIKELCSRYGAVLNVVAKGSAVKVTYQDDGETNTIAQTAASKLNGIVLGGNTVKACVLSTADGDGHSLDYSIDLFNLITKDDIDDEECMEESISDVEKLASNFGKVVNVDVEGNSSNDPAKAFVRIQFHRNDPAVVTKALEGFNGMVIGGQIISASLSISGQSSHSSEMTNPGDKRKTTETPQSASASTASDNMKKARTDDKEPLYSGDKLISERFAAMKRVPKIPNKEGPRAYASTTPTDERIKPLLTEMLGELMRLQKRAIEDKNAKARRRMVMGLREVARGIRAHKVKMVVMANNLDQYGVIDEKLQEIIDLAKAEGVPLFFEFTKRSLGRAIGKSIKIAVVGIQNADGAHQPFKKLNAIAGRM